MKVLVLSRLSFFTPCPSTAALAHGPNSLHIYESISLSGSVVILKSDLKDYKVQNFISLAHLTGLTLLLVEEQIVEHILNSWPQAREQSIQVQPFLPYDYEDF